MKHTTKRWLRKGAADAVLDAEGRDVNGFVKSRSHWHNLFTLTKGKYDRNPRLWDAYNGGKKAISETIGK